MRKSNFVLLAILLCTAGLASCGGPLPSENATNAEAPVDMEFASGWEGIDAIAMGADIKVSPTGHYTTTRNNCFFVAEDGAADIKTWNTFARAMNQAIKLQPLAEEKCFPKNDEASGFDNFAEVRIPGGKRPLFQANGAEVCTKIPDLQLAHEILVSLNKILYAAQTEGCPADPHAHLNQGR